MKKLLLLLILCIYGLPVNAVNFTYKVYDQRVNKSYVAILGTVGANQQKGYLFAFFTPEGKELCLLGDGLTPIDERNGLVGGMCLPREIILKPAAYTSSNNKLLKNVLGWRELSANTFFPEINDIRQERTNEGYNELKFGE